MENINVACIKQKIRKNNKGKMHNPNASQAICNIMLSLIAKIAQDTKIQYIGSYAPFKYEVDITIFNQESEKNGYKIAYVSTSKDNVRFTYDDKLISPEIVILPCIGIIHPKTRVGHGFGGYDKYFAKNIQDGKSTIKIAACFQDCVYHEQEFNIIYDQHDVLMDYVVTENRYY